RNDARPGDRESVGFDAHLFDQIEILFQPVVVIAGNVAGVAIMDATRHVAKGIPYRWLAAVRPRSAFDLEGGRRHATSEISGEAVRKRLRVDHGPSVCRAGFRPALTF